MRPRLRRGIDVACAAGVEARQRTCCCCCVRCWRATAAERGVGRWPGATTVVIIDGYGSRGCHCFCCCVVRRLRWLAAPVVIGRSAALAVEKKAASVVAGREVAMLEMGNRVLCFYRTTAGAAGDAGNGGAAVIVRPRSSGSGGEGGVGGVTVGNKGNR